MNKKLILNAILAISLLSGMIFGTVGTSFAAGSASFVLSPAGGSYDANTTFSVGIYENGTSVNVVTANFSYDTAKLQLVSIDASGSAFPSDAGTSGTSISRYVPAGGTVSGSVQVAVVNFKALAGSGSAAVTVGTAGSHIASNGTEQWTGVASNGSYALTTPVAAPVTPPAATTITNPTASTGTVKGTSTTTANNSTTTTDPTPATTPAASSTAGTTKVPIKKSSSNTDTSKDTHSDWSNAAVTSSTIVLLVAVAGGLYWMLRRRTPVVVPVAYKVGKKATGTSATAAKSVKSTKSKTKTKSASLKSTANKSVATKAAANKSKSTRSTAAKTKK